MHAASQIRNLAIIAHIDHGKTTLIDSIFRAAHVFRENAHVDERVMDSNDLERERGITIRSKHCTVEWKDYLINIIDTPGHADFSGEVERVLSMVDSVLLLVDANEGPMPQTRYVLMRALSFGLRPIVIVNKADRPNADPSGALDKTFDLFVELGANNEQLDFPVLYGSGLEGWIVNDIDEYKKEEHEREEHLHDGGGLSPALLRELADAGMNDLFETIIAERPGAQGRPGRAVPHAGQHARLERLHRPHRLRPRARRRAQGRRRAAAHHDAPPRDRRPRGRLGDDGHGGRARDAPLGHARPREPRGRGGLGRRHRLARRPRRHHARRHAGVARAEAAVAVALPPLEIEEPTVSMFFLVNNGPFAGQDGKAATLRQIKDRLERELRVNVALRVEDLGRPDGVKVSGRGELHLAHPHRGDAPRGPRALRLAPRGHHAPRRQGQAARADGAAHHRRARGVPGRDHPGAQPAQGRAGRRRVDRAPASCASSSPSRRAA